MTMFRGCLMFVFTLFFVSIFAMVAGYFMYTQLARKTTVDTPYLLGSSEQEAVEKINDARLTLLKMVPQKDVRFREGTVIDQNPKPFTKVKVGRKVTIYVAAALEKTKIPDLRGVARTDVGFKLANEKLVSGPESTAYHPVIEAGHLIATNPLAGSEVPTDTPVDVLLSRGPRPLAYVMPDVVGMSESQAKKKFEQLPNDVHFDHEKPADAGLRNKVMSQAPSPGSRLGPQTEIRLVIGR
jgi:serine/threonine-protein kinase